MGFLLPFLAMLTSAPGTGAAVPSQPDVSWCQTGPWPVPAGWRAPTPLEDTSIQFIRREAVASATAGLASISVIPLNRRAYRLLLRRGDSPAAGRYLYLARAGVQVPVDLPAGEWPAFGEEAGYYFNEGGSFGGFTIGSLITSGSPQRPRNYPVLIASPRPIDRVTVGCIGGR
jgi:hypothetical protein